MQSKFFAVPLHILGKALVLPNGFTAFRRLIEIIIKSKHNYWGNMIVKLV